MTISKPVRLLLVAVVLAITGFWYFQSHALYATTSYACSRCRAVERVTTVLGISSERIEQNDYSRWFAQSHPQHDHHWCWCGTYMNHYVLSIGRACGHQHAVWQFQPAVQRQFVEVATHSELEQFYSDMDSADEAQQRRGTKMVWQRLLYDVK